jgi:hypothetical protein
VCAEQALRVGAAVGGCRRIATGEIDDHDAQTVVSLYDAAARAMQHADLTQRIEAFEAKLAG